MNTKRTPPLSVSFLLSPTSPGFDSLPRAVRVAVRKAKVINHPRAHTRAHTQAHTQSHTNLDLDTYSGAAFGEADDPRYLGSNNIDSDFDLDGSQEFADSDGSEELFGLTIVEPGHGNIRRWLKGYDVI